MKVDVDLSQAGEGAEAYEAGSYPLLISACVLKDSKAGNPMLEFRGVLGAGKYEGKRITWTRSLLPNATWSLQNDLGALFQCNVDELPKDANGHLDLDTDDLAGLEATVHIMREWYDDGKDHGHTFEDESPRLGRPTSHVDYLSAKAVA